MKGLLLARRWLLGDQALALLSAYGAGLAAYWQEAPGVMRVAAMSLGPLLIADSLSAGWLQRRMLARGGLSAEQVALLAALDPRDTWRRSAVRFGMTLLLVVLAGVADAITGTPHMTVCWVLLWACGGHGQQTLRRLRVLARPKRTARRGARGPALMAERLPWERYIGNYVTLYLDLLGWHG